MAKLTYKGTTQEVLLALGGSDIDTNTIITITDNQYTLANLVTIVTGRTFPVVLQKTAAAVEIEGLAAQLKIMLAGVDKYTGALKATDPLGVSAADLNTIAAGTTGKVTATLVDTTIDAALVAALKDVKATDAITFKTTDTGLDGNAEINALISLNKILPKADWSNIATIEGTANDVSIIKQALAIAKNQALTVEITGGKISAEDANAIAKLAGGALEATIKDGSVAATLKALANVNASDALTFTSTDKTVKATDLVALNSKIKTGTYTSIETITADAKDVSYVSAALAIPTAAGADVTITGTITAAQANAIAVAATGDLTATVEADTAANLVAKLTSTGTGDILTLGVNGTTATAANLNTLVTKTGGKIKLDATEVTGVVTALTDLYVTNKASFTALGNENVTITGANPTAAELNTIAAATTGKVTATLAPTTTIDQDTVADLRDVKATDNIIFAPTAAIALNGNADINALISLNKILKTDFSGLAASTITGGGNDVAVIKQALTILKDSAGVDVTIAAGNPISAADANALAKATIGDVTATIKPGSVAATLKALTDVSATDALAFTTTDKTASAKDIFALDAKLGTGTADFSSVKTLTGTAADAASGDIAAVLVLINSTPATNFTEVKITGTVALADIGGIITATAGKVTATLAADDAAALVGALTDATLPTGGNAINVTVDDSAATDLATNLTLLAAATSAKVKVDSADVSGNFLQLNQVYVTDKSKYTALGNEDVTVTGPDSALNIDVLAKATTGKVTATVTNADANVLVSQLKNANAKDALAITLTGTTASAKDLLTLDSKTSTALNLGTVTDITGTVAEVKKVVEAGTAVIPSITLAGTENYVLTGTVKAADADAIILNSGTSGTLTANIAADTAAKLVENLANVNGAGADVLNLTVNGATASVADLNTLVGLINTTEASIKVDAKEITGTGTLLAALYAPAAGFANLGNENVKVSDAALLANINNINTILGKTTGVVTASASGTAAGLNAGLTSATAKDALTLTVSTGAELASDLLGLDDKTSVKVDAKAVTGVTGSAVELKKLAAAKGVELAKDVDITLSDTTVNAADLGAILKATTGVVTADVTADTAAKLSAALKDANSSDALTLSVNGVTAAAKDLISLTGKTDVSAAARISLNVGAITGNIADITSVFTNTTDFVAVELGATAATISGTVTAAQADAIADETTGVVTATIAADTAANLLADLTNTTGGLDKLTLKVNGTTAAALDLTALDAKTAIAVDASAIKNIDGTTATGAAEVKAAYDAAKAGRISGLGNETVDLTGSTDADVALVNAINNYTTGLITLPTVTFDKAPTAAGKIFNLAYDLGDLKGITGLEEIDANNGQTDTINISLNDILAANDGKSFSFDITNGAADTVNLNISGWTHDALDTDYTNGKTFTKGNVTIELTVADDTLLTVL